MNKLVEKVIVAWFLLWMAERIPKAISLFGVLKMLFYRKRLDAAQKHLKAKFEDAKYTAEMDWATEGDKVAKAYVEQVIADLDGIPDAMIPGFREDNLEQIRSAYTHFVANVIIIPDTLVMDEQFMGLSRGMRDRVMELRETREAVMDMQRRSLARVGYDTGVIEAKYAPTSTAV